MNENADKEIRARIERLAADILESVTQSGAEDNMTNSDTASTSKIRRPGGMAV